MWWEDLLAATLAGRFKTQEISLMISMMPPCREISGESCKLQPQTQETWSVATLANKCNKLAKLLPTLPHRLKTETWMELLVRACRVLRLSFQDRLAKLWVLLLKQATWQPKTWSTEILVKPLELAFRELHSWCPQIRLNRCRFSTQWALICPNSLTVSRLVMLVKLSTDLATWLEELLEVKLAKTSRLWPKLPEMSPKISNNKTLEELLALACMVLPNWSTKTRTRMWPRCLLRVTSHMTLSPFSSNKFSKSSRSQCPPLVELPTKLQPPQKRLMLLRNKRKPKENLSFTTKFLTFQGRLSSHNLSEQDLSKQDLSKQDLSEKFCRSQDLSKMTKTFKMKALSVSKNKI